MNNDYDNALKDIFMHRLSQIECDMLGDISPDPEEMMSSSISIEYFILAILLSPLRKVEGVEIHINGDILDFLPTTSGCTEVAHIHDQLRPNANVFACKEGKPSILIGQVSPDLKSFSFFHH